MSTSRTEVLQTEPYVIPFLQSSSVSQGWTRDMCELAERGVCQQMLEGNNFKSYCNGNSDKCPYRRKNL